MDQVPRRTLQDVRLCIVGLGYGGGRDHLVTGQEQMAPVELQDLLVIVNDKDVGFHVRCVCTMRAAT